eukprot:gene15041-6202_t
MHVIQDHTLAALNIPQSVFTRLNEGIYSIPEETKLSVAGDVNFHPECFMCTTCKRFIEDGDEYTLEERNCLYCGNCYGSKREKRLEEIKGMIWKNQHTIRHMQLKPEQIDEQGIPLHIDRAKATEPKLREEVLRRAGNYPEKQDKSDTESSISVKGACEYGQQLPLKAGDKVIEVNGVFVTDETIQEVSKLLRSKPTETLHVTIERNLEKRQETSKVVNKSHCNNNQTVPEEKLASGTVDAYDKRKERSLSFFNFSVFKRTTSDCSEAKEKAIRARQKKKAHKTETGTRSKLFSTGKIHQLRRSRSLTEVNGEQESCIKDMVKSFSTLHRAQSFKVEEQPVSKIFRPSELIYGELIGRGFFGDAVKVTSSRTGEVMVMKQLKQVDKDAEETFLNEVQLLKSLKHPNVLHFIGIMYKDRSLHIITEFISGGTLRKLLKNKYREISWKQRIQFAKDIASGMAYLHEMNVIHRDLTSKNCLIKSDSHGKSVIVADFGLAKSLPQDSSCRSPRLSPSPNFLYGSGLSPSPTSPSSSPTPISPTRPAIPKKRLTVVGSPFWMAPEMMKGKGYDEKVDIFSFGIVVCEIIGRVKADPDYLPRKFDFGLDEEEFRKMFCAECPEPFYRLAFQACTTDPEKRPPFVMLEKWLEAIFVNLEFKIPLPHEIDYLSMPKPLMYKIEEMAT